MKYYIWTFSGKTQDSWFLSEPVTQAGKRINGWDFRRCKRYELENEKLTVTIKHEGKHSGMSFGSFGIPFVSMEIGRILLKYEEAGVQLIPVTVEPLGDPMFILNILTEKMCVDESRSVFTKWSENDSPSPEKVGHYRSFLNLFVDVQKTGNVNIFRPWGWNGEVVISDALKSELEMGDIGDTIFICVS